jgi:hypothetical protein
MYVLAWNNLGFGLALTGICQIFDQRQCNANMTCPKSATQSLLNIVPPLIGPIWRKWNGSAVPCLVCLLETTSMILAWLWLKSHLIFQNTPHRNPCMLPGNNNGVLNPENLYLRYRKPVSATGHQCQTQEGSHTIIRYPTFLRKI